MTPQQGMIIIAGEVGARCSFRIALETYSLRFIHNFRWAVSKLINTSITIFNVSQQHGRLDWLPRRRPAASSDGNWRLE